MKLQKRISGETGDKWPQWQMTMLIFGEPQDDMLVLHRMYLGHKGETEKAKTTGRTTRWTHVNAKIELTELITVPYNCTLSHFLQL
jgi:hypothetical protein